MLLWILKQATISLILVAMIHYIYVFFKSNLTIPKVKDLVNKPRKQYEDMYQSMKGDVESSETKNKMKQELQNYLKGLSGDQEPKGATDIPKGRDPFGNGLNYQSL